MSEILPKLLVGVLLAAIAVVLVFQLVPGLRFIGPFGSDLEWCAGMAEWERTGQCQAYLESIGRE